MTGRDGMLPRAAQKLPPVGKGVVGLFRFTPLPAPARAVVASTADGRRFAARLDDHTQRKMLFGVFEPRESAILADLLSPGSVFVDVGAHVGWFTTLAARMVGPAGRVFAFEPFPANAALLRRNVALNGLENVRFTQAVVSGAGGTARVGVQPGSDSGSVTAGERAAERMVEVEAVTLDESVPDDARIALLKIDVEGFEHHVLDGATATLARTGAVLIELNRSALDANGTSPEEIAGRLRDAGFDDHEL